MTKEICVFVEKKDMTTEEWSLIRRKNPRIVGIVEREGKLYEKMEEDVVNWISCEEFNPSIQAILGNINIDDGVKNTMAGFKFEPVSETKGIPTDASEEYMNIVLADISGASAHTYHTLKELRDYNWSSQMDFQVGYLDEAGVDSLEELGRPHTYLTDLPADAIYVNREKMDQLRKNLYQSEEKHNYYTEEVWPVPMSECEDSLPRYLLPLLGELSETETGEDVRILLFFI